MKDKLNITIRIADQAPLPLSINPSEEGCIREAEDSINHLWVTWKERFQAGPDKVMAMIAFQFAKLYTMQKKREKEALKMLQASEGELREVLAQIDGFNAPAKSFDPDAPGPEDHPSLL